MNTDPIADMLTRIRNALKRQFKTVEMPASKLKQAIADVLVKHGYLSKVEKVEAKDAHPSLVITLKYYGGQPVINGLKRVSRPGQRIYLKQSGLIKSSSSQIEEFIVSTSKGVMTGKEAIKASLGGEVLFKVY